MPFFNDKFSCSQKYEEFQNKMLKNDVLGLINFYFNFEVTFRDEAEGFFLFFNVICIFGEFLLKFHSVFGFQLRSSLFLSMFWSLSASNDGNGLKKRQKKCFI